MSLFRDYFDLQIFLATILLVIIGLVSIYSSTIQMQPAIFYKQLTWAIIGLIFIVDIFVCAD